MASELTPAEILNATQQTTHTATPRKPIETWQSRTIKAKLQALAFVHHQDYTHATPRAKKARRLPSKLMSTLTSAEAGSQRPDSPSPRSNAASGRPSVECTPQSPSASARTEQVAHMLRLHPSRKAKNRDWGEERPKWKLPLDRCISPNAIIMPYLPGKELWDLVVMVLVTYTAFQVPLTASFFAGDPSTPPAGLVATMWLIDVVFLADIAVCLRTAYVSEAGNLVTSPRLIRRRYVRSWLALDVLGSVPWDLVAFNVAGGSVELASDLHARRWWRVLLLARLLRLSKLPRHSNDYVRHFGHTDSDAGRTMWGILFGLLLLIHCGSCVLPFIQGFPSTGSTGTDYTKGLVMATMMVFGEAGFAETASGQLFEVAGLVIGGLVISLVYGVMTTQLAQAARRQLQHREHQHLTRETMRRLELPRHMQQLVTSYFDYVWFRHHDFIGVRFLERLPETLRRTISLQVHGAMLRKVAAFGAAPSDMLAQLCVALVPQVFMPADTIVAVHAHARAMYLIHKGAVTVVLPSGEPVAEGRRRLLRRAGPAARGAADGVGRRDHLCRHLLALARRVCDGARRLPGRVRADPVGRAAGRRRRAQLGRAGRQRPRQRGGGLPDGGRLGGVLAAEGALPRVVARDLE